MKEIASRQFDRMGRLNNQVMELIDKSQLTPTEVITILNAISNRLLTLIVTKAYAIKEKDGCNVEKAGL